MYMYNESGSISFIPDYEFLSGSPKKKPHLIPPIVKISVKICIGQFIVNEI